MRKLKNWIDGFLQYTEGKGSPRIYRLWTAIFIIGAIAERKVYLRTVKGQLFPNQYILLVGGAGIGKSLCTRLSYELLDAIRTEERKFFIAPTNVTRASLIDNLAAAERRIIRPMESPAITSFNSLAIIPNEFGVFLPSWEGDFMAALTDLWDNGRYAEAKRTKDLRIEMHNTNLNLLSATTPAQLTNLLPEGAWEFGFMSRMLIVFSGEIFHGDIFAQFSLDEKLYKDLLEDLIDMYSQFGEFTVTDGAMDALNAWSRSGGEPIPNHPKLSSYCTRRAAHLLKLCMIVSMSENSEKIIDIGHYQLALDFLVELETFMPDVFKSMKTGGDQRTIEECWHFIYQVWMKNKKEAVPEQRVWHFLQERTPAHNIERVLDVMERAGVIKKVWTDSGEKGYEPLSKQAA